MNIFKKLKATDYIIIVVTILLIITASVFIAKNKKFSNLPVEKEAIVQFDVFFRGVTISDNISPFKAGEEAFITIRNVPYTKLKIVAMDVRPRMTVLSANNEKGYVIVEDISMPNMYDFIVKLEDKAKKTSDGYVAGGNKIKMGIPVVIEGQKYKYTGTISNVQEIKEVKQ